MEFNSFQNKEIIWNLCLENKLFDGLNNNDHFIIAKEKFDELFNSNSNLSINLTDKNKKVIAQFSEFINQLKIPINKSNFESISEQKYNQEILKPLQEVKITINDNFKNKQEEFDNLININKPKDISFEDTQEDIPFSEDELSKKLENAKKERELVTSNQPSIISKKQVSFQNDSNSDNSDSLSSLESIDIEKPAISFINKLKKNNNDNQFINNNQLDEKLNIIISNQEKIIKLLESQSTFSSALST